MSLTIQCLEVGQLRANCYIVSCDATKHGFIIDPGGDAKKIAAAVTGYDLQIDCILNTHGHPDHIEANREVQQLVGGRLLVHEADRDAVENPPMHWLLIGMRPKPCKVDGTFAEGDEVQVGNLTVKVWHTPGHSPGSCSFLLDKVVFTGDTLFAGGMGRTDFPGGSEAQIRASLKRLVTDLPGDTVVYPGHGPQTTISQEYCLWI